MIAAPVITAAPNADDVSIDITLASMPGGATRVLVFTLSSTGYDNLVLTFTGAGTLNDNNGGSGYGKHTFLRYIAVADNGVSPTDYSYPSAPVAIQVGTSIKFTMEAAMEAIRTILDGDTWLTTNKWVARKYFVDPAHRSRTLFILPGQERPDQPYANGRQEAEHDIIILVANKEGIARSGWETNTAGVERVLELLGLNYEWGCGAYDTSVTEVTRNAEVEGWQPEYPVTRITFTILTQYAKFIA